MERENLNIWQLNVINIIYKINIVDYISDT